MPNCARFDHRAAIRMYQRGASMKAVAQQLSVSPQRIGQILDRHSIPRHARVVPKKGPLTNAEQIRIEYVGGATLSELAHRHHAGSRRVRATLVETGVLIREDGWRGGDHSHCSLPDEEIARRYVTGENSITLAKEYGVTGTTIIAHLRRMKVPIRAGGSNPRSKADA